MRRRVRAPQCCARALRRVSRAVPRRAAPRPLVRVCGRRSGAPRLACGRGARPCATRMGRSAAVCASARERACAVICKRALRTKLRVCVRARTCTCVCACAGLCVFLRTRARVRTVHAEVDRGVKVREVAHQPRHQRRRCVCVCVCAALNVLPRFPEYVLPHACAPATPIKPGLAPRGRRRRAQRPRRASSGALVRACACVCARLCACKCVCVRACACKCGCVRACLRVQSGLATATCVGHEYPIALSRAYMFENHALVLLRTWREMRSSERGDTVLSDSRYSIGLERAAGCGHPPRAHAYPPRPQAPAGCGLYRD